MSAHEHCLRWLRRGASIVWFDPSLTRRPVLSGTCRRGWITPFGVLISPSPSNFAARPGSHGHSVGCVSPWTSGERRLCHRRNRAASLVPPAPSSLADSRCGFQTGNVAQLGIAVARTFDPSYERTYGFEKPDQQALCSVLSFLVGTTLGRIGDRMGAKKRTWLVLATFIQCLCCMAAALAAHYSGEGPYAM